MAVYYKPQSPIQSGEDFIYPITTADQVKVDKDTRLNAVGVYLKNIDNSTDTTVYGNNATTLGGVAAEDYALKTDTAPNSSKLGGKAPEYYIQPRNLLDNSDFRNPVNQRGATSYTTAHSYGIDRWKVGDAGNMWLTTDGPDEKNLAYTGTGDINGSYIYQRFPTTLKAGRTYTLATEFYSNNGLVALSSRATDLGEVEASTTADPSGILVFTFTPSADYTAEDNNTYIRIHASNTVGLRWASLYEGSYTADTLPPYVPKGYAAELAECMRYYKAIKSTAGAYGTTIDAQTGGFVTIDTGIAMYRTPSIILLNELGYLKAGGASYRVTELAINSYDGSMATLKVTCGNSTVPTGNACVLVNTYLAMSADL